MVIVKRYIFYDWQVDTSIILFCSQSCCVHKHSELLSSRQALFYSQHYQIDAASQLFIYLFGITTRKCSSTLRVFLGFAFHQLLGFCGSNTQTRWSQREMSALIWFLVSYGASRDSIHKLSFSALPLIKPFIIHYSIHNADYFPPSKHVQKNFDSSMKQLNKTDSLVVYWTSCCSRLELHSISHMDLNEATSHQDRNFTAAGDRKRKQADGDKERRERERERGERDTQRMGARQRGEKKIGKKKRQNILNI